MAMKPSACVAAALLAAQSTSANAFAVGGQPQKAAGVQHGLRGAAAQDSAASASSGSWASATAVAATAAVAAAAIPRRQRRAVNKLAGATSACAPSVVPNANKPTLSQAKVIVCAGLGDKLPEGRKLRVAVIGGGPAGASAAMTLAEGGCETYLIERKMDNCKPCGGAIPLCMVGEFDLPKELIDRRVRKMTMISPTNKEVQIGETLADDEYIGMVRREVLDSYLRDQAGEKGCTMINGLFMGMTLPQNSSESYVMTYNDLGDAVDGKGTKKTLEVDVVIGADGANSRVAKEIEAGDYEYAIAFQERMRIDDEKMEYYKERAEMYVGDDVSPDFYAWVFPKYDHVAVGTGTVINKKAIKQYQDAIRKRSENKCGDGKIIRVEAHPIPEHPRPRRVQERVALVGDAAGYVTKCSGEGIYFAAKSGRMAAEAIVERTQGGELAVDESDLRSYLDKWDRKYWATYKVLDILQKVFYRSNPAREAFVEMCADEYVQKMTFDSYLYKTVVPGNPLDDIKLLGNTIGSLVRANALRREMSKV